MQRERLCPFYPMAGEVTVQGQVPRRSIFLFSGFAGRVRVFTERHP